MCCATSARAAWWTGTATASRCRSSRAFRRNSFADVAVDLVRAVNDTFAAAVGWHPTRFAAFAAVPTSVPVELERCVGELGRVGTMIMRRPGDEFPSTPRFDPVLRTAAALRVSASLHPRGATAVDERLQSRRTRPVGQLQAILRHWGEMVPFYPGRFDEALPRRVTELERMIGDYVRQGVYITPSGMDGQTQLRYCAGGPRYRADRVIGRLPVHRQRARAVLSLRIARKPTTSRE
ncbi:amidohydrolase family protein [Amycolatopsis sp. CA-128772]|uniref:amidohydrolase family protein n=1 Tax=Amycolatopsis sp. CA-128772 TaxID=2073159 RepID=UPI002101C939|nr:amidohydrolase family protein [Amycolatopsis sp. CA-128772]